MRTGKMCFTSWSEFTDEFVSAFCPENETTMALMWLESRQYFQGKWNIEAYINEYKDLINLSGYMDPIAIVLKTLQGPKHDDPRQNHQVCHRQTKGHGL
jgi:hypothetical protein